MKVIFLLSLLLLLPVASASAYEITIDTNKESYKGGDTVKLSGTVDGGVQGDFIALEIKNTKGDIIVIRTVELGSGGTYTLDFKLPKSETTQELEIVANTQINNEKVTETATVLQVSESISNSQGGGCLIATATYGSELAPQVQLLREIRDNTVLSTDSGVSFMGSFNQFYYSFSPIIADYERENPLFQEAVKLIITPMISTLSIMTLAENGNDAQVLGLGLSVIALNIGMYIVAPVGASFAMIKQLKSK